MMAVFPAIVDAKYLFCIRLPSKYLCQKTLIDTFVVKDGFNVGISVEAADTDI